MLKAFTIETKDFSPLLAIKEKFGKKKTLIEETVEEQQFDLEEREDAPEDETETTVDAQTPDYLKEI